MATSTAPDSPTAAERALMDEGIAAHGLHEYRGDLDAVMATVAPDPVWQFHPLGVRIAGRAAVREVYEVQVRELIPRIAGSTVRTVSYGPRTCTREASYVVALPDGTTADGHGITVYQFDGDCLLAAERIYASGALVPLVASCFPPALLALPGVTRLV